MASLRWIADGIENAERAGGVTLDKRRRLGFVGGVEITPRLQAGAHVSGTPMSDPLPNEYAEDHDDD